MITLLLADDHHLVRKGIVKLLEFESDLMLLGEAADGLEAVAQAEKLRPDVLLLDLSLPRLHGLEVIRQVRRRLQIRVVVLTVHADQGYVIDALRTGASGYVLKDSATEELFKAIRTAASGGCYLPGSLQTPILKRSIFGLKACQEDPCEDLTNREREVLGLAAEGRSNCEISKTLFISDRTVESHRASILRKLDLHTQTELVRFAIRHQIIEV